MISGREGALRCGELCSGGTKGRQLRSTPAKVRQGLLDLADAITKLQLLVILQVEFLLGYARRVLEESFGESVVLSLNSFVFLPADGYVERSWANACGVPLLQLLVRGGTMHRGPLALTDINQFVQQDGIFAVQVNVFLFWTAKDYGVSKSSAIV